MNDTDLDEARAIRARIADNIDEICRSLRADVDQKIDKLAADIERYRQRQRLRELGDQVGGMLWTDLVGAPPPGEAGLN